VPSLSSFILTLLEYYVL
jgi:hypothetical protein